MPTAQGIRVGLSTASVYPENTEAAFRFAADLGFDGVELMVWAEPVSQDPTSVERLVRRYGVPVLAVHVPCLLISQRVWGSDPAAKLDRSVRVAEILGAETVVAHPPFRWQRRYAEGFSDQVAALEADSHVVVAVENMYPMRADVVFGGRDRGAERLRRRGPGRAVSAYSPSLDPTDTGFAHYTLDLSHTATAGADALALADRMGEGLTHLHLADGRGSSLDEHLVPGTGTQPCADVCRRLAESDFGGHVVLEISTQSARTRAERAGMLARSLAFARTHLDRSATRAITAGPESPRHTDIARVPASEAGDSGGEHGDA
ncbi:sugar phosphate isomerase/epimerase family protein [Rhodococcus rhodochrous]|uniref:sugar phosphate isomerase/epimerase family protein n=1 Tax=Rhodococcus rhodochrous TaxID=1829 RepID=UPI001E498AF7|nr:sugar phosphate isomerase/epimerase [Rhodococcus rhodochrous]MCD2097194.1 sugar phosphate isomerase/epimerase [Rhodococcus rhodochrous]MCD2120374.1 sugar phosphate isomerase/epimerase [Rhodococcus rhodochrous]MCQ4133154.1 sugar phosphate isomerase/epimerase [Rhodococcus rhodochrous]MDJ0017239.1 sugar phosphate isomerase/epimerase [Rhodococcus rhodochrous]